MKTKILLGAAITVFAVSTFATDALLTPRQKDSQSKIATSSIDTQGGTVTHVSSGSSTVLSPRAKDNQSTIAAGVANDLNPALACAQRMSGTPKMIGECASHTTMPGCMTVASSN